MYIRNQPRLSICVEINCEVAADSSAVSRNTASLIGTRAASGPIFGACVLNFGVVEVHIPVHATERRPTGSNKMVTAASVTFDMRPQKMSFFGLLRS